MWDRVNQNVSEVLSTVAQNKNDLLIYKRFLILLQVQLNIKYYVSQPKRTIYSKPLSKTITILNS